VQYEIMTLFERLKTAAHVEWRAYTEHPFVAGLADGTLPAAAFRHYLVQDYLFLIEFARAYALAVYKSPRLADMREALSGLSAILDVEMNLHVKLCGTWGLSPDDLEQADPAAAMLALAAMCSMRGCVAICWRSKWRLLLAWSAMRRSRHGSPRALIRASQPTLIARGSRSMPVSYTKKSRRRRGRTWTTLPNLYVTPTREAELIAIFKQATRLETDFWEMGWRASLHT
jgi:thiaminase/transcriptional activator TenA